MDLYYKLGNVYSEMNGTIPVAEISRYGFLGSLAISIEGKENIQLRRSAFGLQIFTDRGKVGKVFRLMNITFKNEVYLIKIAELAKVVRGNSTEAIVTGRDGEIGRMKKSGEFTVISMDDTSNMSVMLIYAAIAGMYDRTLNLKKNPFPSNLRVVSGFMYIVGIALFIFFPPDIFGPYGLQIVLISVIILLIVGSVLRVAPPKIPSSSKFN